MPQAQAQARPHPQAQALPPRTLPPLFPAQTAPAEQQAAPEEPGSTPFAPVKRVASKLPSLTEPDEQEDEMPRKEYTEEELAAYRPSKYTWLHLVILVVVAFVLGMIIWLIIDDGTDFLPGVFGSPVETARTYVSAAGNALGAAL